jgi:signal transduction histidine kinase
MVSIDKNKFRQILYNLVSNAIKFNKTGGGFNVESGPAPNDSFYLKVSDTGIGITAENIKKLFMPFVQLDPGTTRRHEGTGLGLALTKTIVELQNGTITVQSTPGEGSVFTVILPVKIQENK